MRAWLPLQALSTRVRGAARRSSHVLHSSARSLTALRRRLAPTAAPTEADVLRVGLEALRVYVPTASAVALFTLPPGVGGGAEDAASASWPDQGGQPPTLCTSYHAPELPEAAREALRDALRRVTCGDPATSVARLCDAAYAGTLTGSLQALTRDDAESGGAEDEEWAATESSDWLDGTATFSDWQAAREAGASGVRFMTLTIAPTAGLGRKPALAAVLIRFDAFRRTSLTRPRPMGLRAGTRLRALVARARALLPPAAPRPPVSGASAIGLRRVCSALGDALLSHRSAAAAAALAHTTALARDIYPVHLVDRMKARHSVALSRSSSSGPLAALTAAAAAAATLDATAATAATTTSAEAAARHMLCESHESVTVCFVDIVGWTRLAGEMTAEEAMALLDRLYQRFDTLSLAHGVYKARWEQGRLGVLLLARVCCVCSADVMWMCVCVCVCARGAWWHIGPCRWRPSATHVRCCTRSAALMPTHPADCPPFFLHPQTWRCLACCRRGRTTPPRRCASRWTCTRRRRRRRCTSARRAATAATTTAGASAATTRPSACASASACTPARSQAASVRPTRTTHAALCWQCAPAVLTVSPLFLLPSLCAIAPQSATCGRASACLATRCACYAALRCAVLCCALALCCAGAALPHHLPPLTRTQVNTASRMESTGRARCVQLSDAAFAATGLPPGLLPERRFEVKGKGTMQTHIVEADSDVAESVQRLLSTELTARDDEAGGAARAVSVLEGTAAAGLPRVVSVPRLSRQSGDGRDSQGVSRALRRSSTRRTPRSSLHHLGSPIAAGGADAKAALQRAQQLQAPPAGWAALPPLARDAVHALVALALYMLLLHARTRLTTWRPASLAAAAAAFALPLAVTAATTGTDHAAPRLRAARERPGRRRQGARRQPRRRQRRQRRRRRRRARPALAGRAASRAVRAAR
jgi:hypothetical protein